ncbi:MAG: glycosyltransferase family 39 protein [Chloroflexi bacterium]|nr:glycosyltransferase family 39 protein [Chloroflexota bacterium]
MTDRTLAAWLGLLLFGIYLLSFSGQLYSQDSMSMFSVTESFVKRGEFNTDQLWTLFKARDEIARDGESYAKYGYGMSLFAAPLYALALWLDLGLAQTTLLTSSIVIAMSGAHVFLSARRLKFTRGVSLIAALLYGLATPAWVYAKQFWSEPYSLFTLFAAFYFLQCFRDERRARDGFIAGAMLGVAVATRVTNAALIPVFAWYAFWDFYPHPNPLPTRERGRGIVAFAFALGIMLFSIAGYDWMRYGSPLATGYRADETFNTPFLLGAYGLLFSPGRGLFVYVPFLAALAFSCAVFFRRARRETNLFFAIFVFYVLIFSTWYYWWGGTNWGPRFLVPTIPFLVLMIAPAIELAQKQKWFAIIFSVLCLLSFCFQLFGISIPSLAYRQRMLRVLPNADWDTIFIPQFSPLVGYWNMLRPSTLDFAWVRVVDGIAQTDWLIVALTVAFIAFCALSLRAILAKQSPNWLRIASSRKALLAMTIAIAALALFSMYRYRDDPRLSAGEGYRALMQTLAREEHPRDVMILNDDARAPAFLNANRARLRWYGLSRDPKQFDDATRALLTRLSHQYARVWFAYDDITADLPDPTRDWLDANLRGVNERDLGEGVHLVLYATDKPYARMQRQSLSFAPLLPCSQTDFR